MFTSVSIPYLANQLLVLCKWKLSLTYLVSLTITLTIKSRKNRQGCGLQRTCELPVVSQ